MLELQAFTLCAKTRKLRQTKRSGGAAVKDFEWGQQSIRITQNGEVV